MWSFIVSRRVCYQLTKDIALMMHSYLLWRRRNRGMRLVKEASWCTPKMSQSVSRRLSCVPNTRRSRVDLRAALPCGETQAIKYIVANILPIRCVLIVPAKVVETVQKLLASICSLFCHCFYCVIPVSTVCWSMLSSRLLPPVNSNLMWW